MKKDKHYFKNKFNLKYKCKFCKYGSNDVNEVKSHEETQHGFFRDNHIEESISHKKKKIKQKKEKNVIEYPTYKFKFESSSKPTTDIDLNKITYRLLYGDDKCGKPERDMYGRRAYNGNNTVGAINKLNSSWVKRKKEIWKTKDKNSREYKLYQNLLKENDFYVPIIQNRLKPILYPVKNLEIKEYGLPDSVLIELLLECLYDKFGHSGMSMEDNLKDDYILNFDLQGV